MYAPARGPSSVLVDEEAPGAEPALGDIAELLSNFSAVSMRRAARPTDLETKTTPSRRELGTKTAASGNEAGYAK